MLVIDSCFSFDFRQPENERKLLGAYINIIVTRHKETIVTIKI